MISPLAFVHPEAIIGNNVTIEPFAYVDSNTVIGDGTWIGPNATVFNGSRIGKDCKIFPAAAVGGIPQDLKFCGEETLAIIGDRTSIRECATVHRGTKSKGQTIVGSDCLIMSTAHIAHDCVVGNHVIMGNFSGLAGEVEVDDWAIISANTLVHQFSRIGAHIITGGGAKVRLDVPPYIIADRDPLSFMGVNKLGLSRRGFSSEKIEAIHEIYRTIYLRHLTIDKALSTIEAEFPQSEERDYIIDFFRTSKRGVIRQR